MSTPSNKAITAAEKRYPDDGKMNTPDGPQTFPSPRVLCQRGAYATCYDELSERATQLEGERDAIQREVEALRRELAPHDEQEQARREAEDGYNSAMETAGF